MDDQEKERSLTVVAENSSATIEKQRALNELRRANFQAAEAIKQLSINLLRVIAGAGEPWNLLRNIDDARTSCVDYLIAADKLGQPANLPTEALELSRLFLSQDKETEPTTEEGWRRWASPSDPHEEYFEHIKRAKVELRRAALRQVAAVLSKNEKREPHLRAHGGNLDEIIQDIIDAERQLDSQNSRPRGSSRPERLAIANGKIAALRRDKRVQQIKSLPAHQIAGLIAVEAGTAELTDGFTLDTLGRMELLMRLKGNKSKSAWQLTDDGRLAIEMHRQRKDP
jgi:hypothetical protein